MVAAEFDGLSVVFTLSAAWHEWMTPLETQSLVTTVLRVQWLCIAGHILEGPGQLPSAAVFTLPHMREEEIGTILCAEH